MERCSRWDRVCNSCWTHTHNARGAASRPVAPLQTAWGGVGWGGSFMVNTVHFHIGYRILDIYIYILV